MRLPNIIAPALLLGLAACVTTTPHNLNVDDVRAFNIQRVDVAFAPEARIIWPTLANEMAEARRPGGPTRMPDVAGSADGGTPAPPKVEISPAEYKAQAMTRVTDKARKVLQPSLKAKLAGTRPVVARMTVHHLFVPSMGGMIAYGVVTGLLVGPYAGTLDSGMSVSVDFVDARTGAPILSYPKTGLTTQGGHRVDWGTTGTFAADPVERMLVELDGRLSPWLLKS
jgi:hypothetical protein